jgi:signal transduction histidine kinase
MAKDKNGIDEYLSWTRHELRTQIAVTREGISQVLDGLGGQQCAKCTAILKPALECADKLEKMVGELLAASAIEDVLRKRGDHELEAFKKDLTAVISHLVRTPLAIANEGLSLVLDGVPGGLNNEQKKLLLDVKEAFARLIRDVEKVLETPWERIIKK